MGLEIKLYDNHKIPEDLKDVLSDNEWANSVVISYNDMIIQVDDDYAGVERESPIFTLNGWRVQLIIIKKD